MAREYRGLAGVGEWFDVSAATVSKWLTRYAGTHPCPTPDVTIDGRPGWAPSRERAWRKWERERPGAGAGGGRPRQSD
jgi:hypothetical protein